MARWGYQRRKARQELGRRHEPHLVGVFDTVADPAILEHRKPLEREGRASAVAKEAFARGDWTEWQSEYLKKGGGGRFVVEIAAWARISRAG